MGHWCNWPLVVWAFIAIFLLSSLWFMWNNCVWQLPASYTSTASNIRKRPITPGLLYIIHILGSKPLFCTNTLGRGREQHVMCVVEIETVFVKYLISVSLSVSLSLSPCNTSTSTLCIYLVTNDIITIPNRKNRATNQVIACWSNMYAHVLELHFSPNINID